MYMRKCVILFAFLISVSLTSFAGVDSKKAVYVGGTVAELKQETEGTFSAADPKEMVFQYKQGKFTVPYDRIDSLEYGQKAGRRVGLTIAVTPIALLSKKRRHFLTLNYKDADDKEQAAVFELGKDIVRVTLSSMEARTGRKVEYQDEEARNSSKGN
jgi:hypothetical protein